MVAIDKPALQAPGKLPPNGGFSGARQADEGDQDKNSLRNRGQGTLNVMDLLWAGVITLTVI